jgi:diguanylate cyclase (GGDEF)-like protein/PAS domain S-box-containing protein
VDNAAKQPQTGSNMSRPDAEDLERLFDLSSDVLCVSARDSTILAVNPSFTRVLGYTESELIGRPFLFMIHPDDLAQTIGEVSGLARGEPTVMFENRCLTATGRARWFQWSAQSDQTSGRIYASGRDVTEQHDVQESLARSETTLKGALDEVTRIANSDLLTGLLNRDGLMKELDLLPSMVSSYALLMTDIDGLKSINDIYGHIMGDLALVAVAECLTREDAIVGRYGGDEFLTILKNAGRREAELYREKVTSSLSKAKVVDPASGNPIEVMASLGIAIYPDDTKQMAELLALSDEAMYAEKRRRPRARMHSLQKYELNLERLASILGAFVPLFSDVIGLGDKIDGLAHRLLTGTGYEGIVVTLFPRPAAGPIVRSALSSNDALSERQVDAHFESMDFADYRTWQTLSRSGKTMVVTNLEMDERIADSDRTMARASGLGSLLIAPMKGPDGLIGAVHVGSLQEDGFGSVEIRFFNAVAEQMAAMVATSMLLDEIRSATTQLALNNEAAVLRLAAAAEVHDPAVGPHLRRVRQVSELLALELGLSATEALQVGLAAALHDVGKLYVPESLLSGSEVLTSEEKKQFRKHTYLGSKFLAGPGTELAAKVAQSHHERWDGSGYPDGLRGEEIPEAARITSVADVLDAITTERSYQQHRSLAFAIAEISSQSGKQFSPQVVKALVTLYERGALAEIVSVESRQVESLQDDEAA